MCPEKAGHGASSRPILRCVRNLTLILDLARWPGPAGGPDGAGPMLRSPDRTDVEEIGRLYFRAYPPGLVGDSVVEAVADIEASWDGVYGELWEEASVVAESDGRIVGVLLTVRHAPWPDTPPGPFIIELFVDPEMRGRSVARRVLEHGLSRLVAAGATSVALRVLADNEPALGLYRSVGFVDWSP